MVNIVYSEQYIKRTMVLITLYNECRLLSNFFNIFVYFIGMENSAYVPNTAHLNSPALVVFSQAAGGLQDTLRIQRPFNPQVMLILLPIS